MVYRLLRLIAVALFSSLALADDAPQTGNYVTTFTQRSPLSSLKTMTARMKLDKTAKDYDPSEEKWSVQVPADYTPDKPMGLIVQLIFRDKDSFLNADCTKLLADRNIAFVSRQHGGGDPVAKAGEALDAAYNMQQKYHIDPTRLYLFYFVPITNHDETVGLQLFTGYPDVFSGAMIHNIQDFWTPMRAANGGVYPVKVPPPPPQYRTAGAKHPLVLQLSGPDEAFTTMLGKAWGSQGYKWVKCTSVDLEAVHYPNFNPEWLGGVIDYLDQHKVPTTRPAATKTSEK
jgi:hypothetical protein